MSTSIDVYPTTGFFPLVEDRRRRTQELYQQLLDRHSVDSTIEVKAFYPKKDGEQLRRVDPDVRWKKEMALVFAYWVNGEWSASSWPYVVTRERIDEYWVRDFEELGPEYGYPASMLGELIPLEKDDFGVPISDEELKLLNSQDHSWYDDRNMGGPAVSSIGYGLAAAAIAEATRGRIASDDGAFSMEHSGETAEQFLQWWGDEQLSFYGTGRFYR